MRKQMTARLDRLVRNITEYEARGNEEILRMETYDKFIKPYTELGEYIYNNCTGLSMNNDSSLTIDFVDEDIQLDILRQLFKNITESQRGLIG